MADVDVIRPISTLLVANRGEIARRIFRTARDMGINTVAVYADGDAEAPFVKEADTAFALQGRTSAETYLDIQKILEACRASGADALHPGYGFLSENKEFAQAVIDAGLRWIGPTPAVIGQMGDKLSAKKLMQEAGVPTLPAVEIKQDTDLVGSAKAIGYPVLVKASAGGGGRGMRVVEAEADLAFAVESAKREAGASFGDDTVFLEKWLDKTRHVEIQIIGDTHGNVVHCFERECSIQRRHQKIIEEAPSPGLTESARRRMCNAALSAAKSLDYSSAGTVEFLLSGDEFWFLEVNARLQVEHPVTEEIIGHDLVREQIRVAEGEKLSFNQDDLAINGHAIEARLCAEDPSKDFLPSPGEVLNWVPSRKGSARFDAGVETGSVVNAEFDAMIAKVIVHAPTRREAASRLARVLETTSVQGLTTNRDFLVAALRTSEFLTGDTTTDFIERACPSSTKRINIDDAANACVAVAVEARARRQQSTRVLRGIPAGFRHTAMPPERIGFEVQGEEFRIEYTSTRSGTLNFQFGDDTYSVRVFTAGDGTVDFEKNGQRHSYDIKNFGERWFVCGRNGEVELRELPRFPDAAGDDVSGGLKAPMPGVVLSTHATAGERVEKGQILLVLEAMKMEHKICAPVDGIVSEIHVLTGDQVANDQLLVSMSQDEKGA